MLYHWLGIIEKMQMECKKFLALELTRQLMVVSDR
jgi:hypothetical protein